MDTQRFVLFLIFATSLLFLWDAWQKEQYPATQAPTTAVQGTEKQAGADTAETPVP
jgi:YidC/Oxa1 family membrane protein insertase